MKTIYCQICECEYKLEELKQWTGRDILELLCPGCDDTLIAPDCYECSNSATGRLLHQGKIYYCCDEGVKPRYAQNRTRRKVL